MNQLIKRCALPVIVLALFGCKPAGPDNSTEKKQNLPVAIKVPITIEEWRTAFMSSYKDSQVKDNGDGITEFMAQFGGGADKSAVLAFGKRDAFRKLSFFKTAGAKVYEDLGPSVGSYISVPDGEMPVIFLSPYFLGKNGWLFMNKISVMVDGEVIFERDFSDSKVSRNSETYGVEERYDFIANESDIAALRKITPASKIVIRLSGDKGYVNLEKKGKGSDYVKIFKDSIIEDLFIYDSINRAVTGHIPSRI